VTALLEYRDLEYGRSSNHCSVKGRGGGLSPPKSTSDICDQVLENHSATDYCNHYKLLTEIRITRLKETLDL